MKLQDRLNAITRPLTTSATVPAAYVRANERARRDLLTTNALADALRAGDGVPVFRLSDADGKPHSSERLHAEGPLVLVFFSGGWCAYAATELVAFNELRRELAAHEVSLVAVSPQTVSSNRRTADALRLSYPVLSDPRGQLAKAFGLHWAMPVYLRRALLDAGVDVCAYIGDESWTVPLPARYLVDRGGYIVYADVGVDPRFRSDPKELLTALALLPGGNAWSERGETAPGRSDRRAIDSDLEPPS